MKFVSFSQHLASILVFTHLVAGAGCKTTSPNALQADGSEGAEDSVWLLVPNLENVFGPAVIQKTVDPKSPTATSQICLFFDPTPRATQDIQPQTFQLWLENDEFCSEWEKPGKAEAPQQHQFLSSKALPVKNETNPAWILYLGDQATGQATIDTGTGLPLIQSLCSGSQYGKVCHVEASPTSIRIVPGA